MSQREPIDEPMESAGGTEVTDMEILALLLQEAGIELHTTIHNPIGMTAVDQGLALIKAEFGYAMWEFCNTWVVYFRRNMVAEDGGRATGIMHAVAAKQEENKKKSRTEAMLGDLSR